MSRTLRFFNRGLFVFCALCLLASLVSAAPSRQLTPGALTDIRGGSSDPLCTFTQVRFDCFTTPNCASINPAAGCRNGICNSGNGVIHCSSTSSNWYKSLTGTTHKQAANPTNYTCGVRCDVGSNSYCALWTPDKCGCFGSCVLTTLPCNISEISLDLCL